MAARTPEEVHGLWAQRFAAGDLEGLVALYEEGAALAPAPGELFTGHAAIREALSRFLALKPRFEMHVRQAIRAGDIAILYSQWELEGTGPDGQELSMSGHTTDVVRQQSDGNWLLVIDNPFGASAPPAAAE
jgi:uncharacterized protein (TIGR02246 family)